MVWSKSIFKFWPTWYHSVRATTLLRAWINLEQSCDDVCHSSNQATRNRRIELLEYLYLVQLYDEFKSACSIRQLFDSLPRSEHLQNQPDSSVSCRKWFSGQSSGCESQACLKANPHRSLKKIKRSRQARSPDWRSRTERPLHFATACVNFCKRLDHHVWNNWSPGSCRELWGSLLHAQSLQKR